MRYRLYILAFFASLLLMMGSGLLWRRSYKAHDEFYGHVGQRSFEIEAYYGGLDIFVRRSYRAKPGEPELNPNDPPLSSLQEESSDGAYSAERLRWPLDQADEYWQAYPPLFAGFKYAAWWGWRPKEYLWCRMIRLPYWFISLCGAAAAMFTFVKRRRKSGRGSTTCCTNCWYDLRATPQRCPECGKIP